MHGFVVIFVRMRALRFCYFSHKTHQTTKCFEYLVQSFSFFSLVSFNMAVVRAVCRCRRCYCISIVYLLAKMKHDIELNAKTEKKRRRVSVSRSKLNCCRIQNALNKTFKPFRLCWRDEVLRLFNDHFNGVRLVSSNAYCCI